MHRRYTVRFPFPPSLRYDDDTRYADVYERNFIIKCMRTQRCVYGTITRPMRITSANICSPYIVYLYTIRGHTGNCAGGEMRADDIGPMKYNSPELV